MTETSGPSTTPPLEIAHVLFMDIVAYSALHMDQQQQLLQNLQEAVRSTPAFARAQANDQLIRLPTGDGMALAFFGDPEAPVRCALELGKHLLCLEGRRPWSRGRGTPSIIMPHYGSACSRSGA